MDEAITTAKGQPGLSPSAPVCVHLGNDFRPQAPMSNLPIRHALSVDVEDWYHDGGVTPGARRRSEWSRTPSACSSCWPRSGARATFFFLGEVAERYPHLVRRAADAGHEIGSHGYGHRHLSQLLWREFRDDVARSLAVLRDVSGSAGAAAFARRISRIKAGVRWPIELLGELGLLYDSSILAIDRPPGLELVSPRTPFRHANGLWEVPVAVLQLLRFWHLPLASGAGLRLLPPRLCAVASPVSSARSAPASSICTRGSSIPTRRPAPAAAAGCSASAASASRSGSAGCCASGSLCPSARRFRRWKFVDLLSC